MPALAFDGGTLVTCREWWAGYDGGGSKALLWIGQGTASTTESATG